jgi:hypothetical protein
MGSTLAFNANLRPVKVEELVPGTPNHKLLDNEFYKAGYKRCHDELMEYIQFLLTAKPKELRKYAGKPK